MQMLSFVLHRLILALILELTMIMMRVREEWHRFERPFILDGNKYTTGLS